MTTPINVDPNDVSLTPYREEFLETTFRWINDPRIAVPFLFNRKVGKKAHLSWFDSIKKDQTQCLFAVLDGNNQYVGNLGFKFLDQAEPEMWLYIGPEHQGQGWGKQAAIAGVKTGLYGFNRESIVVRLATDNSAARSIYTTAGFKKLCDDDDLLNMEKGNSEISFMRAQRSKIAKNALRVAMMQPMFLPWLGLFELIDVADTFIFLDDFQFSRQSWGQRNRIFLSPGKDGYITLPVSNPIGLQGTFRDVIPNPDSRWLRKVKANLIQTYGKMPHFTETFSLIEPYLVEFARGEKCLADLQIRLTKKIATCLSLSSKFHLSSEFNTHDLKRSERILALIEAVGGTDYYAARGALSYMKEDGVFDSASPNVYIQNFQPQPYPQPGASSFVPRLSVIDAMFALGASGTKSHVRGTYRWQHIREFSSEKISD